LDAVFFCSYLSIDGHIQDVPERSASDGIAVDLLAAFNHIFNFCSYCLSSDPFKKVPAI
jgi:hypothetical protein